jgi:hypothetical protein
MDVDMEKASNSPAPITNEKQSVSRPQTSRARAASLPEVDLYIHLIVLLYLIDRNSLKSVRIKLIYFLKINFIFRLLIVQNV